VAYLAPGAGPHPTLVLCHGWPGNERSVGRRLISVVNMGAIGALPRADLVKISAGSLETLAGTSPEQMADELIAGGAANNFLQMAPGLARKQLLVLSSDDGLAPDTDKLAAATALRLCPAVVYYLPRQNIDRITPIHQNGPWNPT
jgi:hypothetical protein